MSLLPVAILAGGLATRIRPITEKTPKSLIQIAGKPFIFHQLEYLKIQGISEVVICLGYFGEQIIQAVGDGKKWGLKIQYSFDGPTLVGTGGAILNAIKKLGRSFFVLYGDSYLPINYKLVQMAYEQGGLQGLMTILKNDNLWDKSNVNYVDGTLIEYNKRHPSSTMKYIDYGLGILSENAFIEYSVGDKFDLADIYHQLSISNELTGYEVNERFYEIGSFPGIEEAKLFLSKDNKQ